VSARLRAWGRRAVGTTAAWLLAACPHAPDGSPSAAEPSPPVRFVGRFDLSEPEHPRFAWSASAIQTRFTGKTLHVHLRGTGYDELQVVVDGAPSGVIAMNPSKEDYEVVSGLGDGPHELVLSKRTEPRVGEVQFLGFEPGVALAPPVRAPGRRIELIGDSITAGYGAEGVGPRCTGSAFALENEFLSYGALAARSVGAEHVTVAWSGRTTEEMNDLYDRILPARPASRWDFTKWTPDAVVINLGTNEFNHADPGQGAFTKPYLAFVQKVRAVYPRAVIVCALGPMLTDNYPTGVHALTRARGYISQVVTQLRNAGDTRVSFLEFPSQDFANGLGCDYHPSLKTHRLMAEQLTRVLRAQLQW
jgi:lysophospholipase L1-like esterase